MGWKSTAVAAASASTVPRPPPAGRAWRHGQCLQG
jgi:hypothetical protein